MKTVVYLTSSPLSCACDQDVVLCVADSVTTADGAPFIDASLTTVTSRAYVDACGVQQVTYYNTFSYNETQLNPSTYSLVPSDIEGVICDLCLLRYIDYKTTPIVT